MKPKIQLWSARSCGHALPICLVTGGISVMPSPVRRPSRSVTVPGRGSGPVRLGRQSPGCFFAPYLEWPDTGSDSSQPAHGPAIPPQEPQPEEPSRAHDGPAAVGQPGADPNPAVPVTLVALAHSHPVNIISFGANQAGASPGVPVRSAEIAGAPGPGSTPAVSALALRSFLSSQQPPYRPSIVAVTTASRRTVLRVRVSGAQPAWPARHAQLR